jgi:hypothetical protein
VVSVRKKEKTTLGEMASARRCCQLVAGIVMMYVVGAAAVNKDAEDGWQPTWEESPEHPPRIP